MSVNSKMTAIADEIRDKTGKAEPLTLDQMAESISKVYRAGQQSEYDRFWDNHPTAKGYCSGGNLFSGAGWNDITFKPKYDIVLGSCYMAFKGCAVTDLVEKLKECGVSLDFSRTNDFYYAFAESKLTHIGDIPLTHERFTTASTATAYMFAYCYSLHTIDKIILNDKGTTMLATSNMFLNATSLENVTFEGVIGNSINFQWCPLSKASITNIVEHLSPTVTGQTLTLNKATKEATFTDDEWAELIATKPSWTFSLI